MKVFDLLLAVAAVITGIVVLMRIPHSEFFSRTAFVGMLFIAGGLTYLWKHRWK
jgi:uncharacterized membrane protein HdeD (DUF308 family)